MLSISQKLIKGSYLDSKVFVYNTVHAYLKSSQIMKTGQKYVTRKYPLRRYILGVLTHTTAWDRLWGGDYTLKGVSIHVALLHFA